MITEKVEMPEDNEDKLELPKNATNRLIDWLYSKMLMSDNFATKVRQSVKSAQFMRVETFQLEDLFEIEFRLLESSNNGLVFKIFRAHQSVVHIDVFYNDINIPKEFRDAVIMNNSEQLEIWHMVRRILDLAHHPHLSKYFEHWESARHRLKFLAENPKS